MRYQVLAHSVLFKRITLKCSLNGKKVAHQIKQLPYLSTYKDYKLLTRAFFKRFNIAILTLLLICPIVKADNILELNYEGFTIWLDCDRRGAVMFRYNAQRDTGNHKRKKNFYIDPNVPSECQQKSTASYKSNLGKYDRGHLVPANHLDFSANAIKQSNYMVNILPQSANFNRGSYLRTEEIVECLRDYEELLVIGGVIWGNDPNDDYFLQSHGVATPDAFWKVIIRNDRVIAWIMPNSSEATAKMLDKYLVSVTDIEKISGVRIPVDDYLKYDVPSSSWLIPKGCNKG